jgi:hypothetical protein
VAKEPILRDAEARVFMECLDEKIAVPKRNSTVGERGRTDLASKCTLDTAELVLEILGSVVLLGVIMFSSVR